MPLPSKLETICRHLPKRGKVLVPEDYDKEPLRRCSKCRFQVRGDGFAAAIVQYTGRNAKDALSHISEVILRMRPGGVLVVDGHVQQKSLIRAANKAVGPAINALLILRTIEAVVQVDEGPGEGVFIGRVSR